ncbi:MAG: hypothetical protein ACD_41C00337G0010 [uncultured bacterium]|nr:MAG: hypothetical protein ACD_41C00337G0010 [uncultured bacterium]HBY73326.1 50S ribosomal protein L13 [Candidatus Kerfeldbacteria bacterium]
MNRTIQTVDATLVPLGRLAVKVAGLLMGKHKPDYKPYTDCGDTVKVINIAAMKLDPKKLAKTEIKYHTLHPGGLKRRLAKTYTASQLLRHAINNMLPKNKLRDRMLKRLTIE